MATITLTQLITEIRDLGDYSNDNVFSDAYITRHINDAIGEYRDLLDEQFEGYHDKTGTVVTVAGTATVALPSDFLSMRAVDLLDGDQYRPLTKFTISQTYGYGGERDQPVGYMQIGTNLELFPTPDAVYTLRLRYVPSATDLASGSDSITCPNGWEKFIVYTALAALDDREERDISARLAVADRIRQRIMAAAKRRNTAGPRYVPFPGEGDEVLL